MPEDQLSLALIQGRRILLWIGAGISASAGIPTDSAAHGLAHRLALVHYGNEEAVTRELGTNFRLADLAARIGKPRVRDLILQQAWQDLRPTTAHRAIAAIVAEGYSIDLVTTNFDPLIEKALSEQDIDVPFKVVTSAATAHALSEGTLAVVKLHGCPYTNDDPNDLLMLVNDLSQPPGWVITFLNGRLQERVFVYIGFSGDAPYVQRSIEQTLNDLQGMQNEAYAIDRESAETVFDSQNDLGRFYSLCGVTQENYSGEGSDTSLRQLADSVLREVVLEALSKAAEEATDWVAIDETTLQEDIRSMSFEAVRSFARRLAFLSHPERPTRIKGVCLKNALEWMLILASCALLENASFRPALASPFYPGPNSTASGPVVLLDGFGEVAEVCRSEVERRYEEGDIQSEFVLRGCARLFYARVNPHPLFSAINLEIQRAYKESELYFRVFTRDGRVSAYPPGGVQHKPAQRTGTMRVPNTEHQDGKSLRCGVDGRSNTDDGRPQRPRLL